MIPYFGDFAEDATIYIPFNTFDSNDPSASVTITNLVDADIKVHKDGSVTQIVTDGATVAIDFDGITGNHLITIDTSVHADYAIGSDYLVRIEGTTVDAGTINAFVGSFSIENRFNAAADDLANATDGLGALKTLIDTLTTNVATVDTVVDGIQTDLSNGTDGLGAIKADTSAILTDTGTTLETHLTDIKGATWSSATDTLEAIRDRGDAAWITGAGGTPPQLLQNTTIATLASQTSFTLTAGSADNDAYNGAAVVVTDSATSTQKAVGSVSDYVGATKTITLTSDPAIFTMAAGDTIDIIANVSAAPTAVAIRTEIDSNSTQLAAIVADTNELQTDWVNGGRLDLILDARASQTTADAILVDTGTTLPATLTTIDTVVDGIQTDLSNATDGLGAIKADTAAILTDTGTTIPATIATVGSNVDAILVDTGTTLPALLPAALAADGSIKASLESVKGTVATATAFEEAVKCNVIGTVGSASTTTSIVSSSITPAGTAADQFKGRILTFHDDTTTASLRGQATDITANTAAAAPTFTVTALTTAAVSGDTFTIT